VSESPIILEQDGAIARLRLNTPPRNEMDRAFFDAFCDLTTSELPRLQVEGLIVHGSGRHFSSGANVVELTDVISAGLGEQSQALLAKVTRGFQTVSTLPFPVVAAISGCCLGSAMELALACHFRIAARNAVLALPETTLGLIPGCGATARLPKLVGVGKAIELVLTGRSLLAEEAKEIGLVDVVVGRQELLASAEKLIHRLNRNRSALIA